MGVYVREGLKVVTLCTTLKSEEVKRKMSKSITITEQDSCDNCPVRKGCGVQDPKDKKCMANNFERIWDEIAEEKEDHEGL